MAFQYFVKVSLFLCGLQLASALPASKIAGSADIKHVKQHTHEDSYYRRDGPSIYARSSNCSPLTLDQVKALPGWPKIQKYASDTYGDGSVNIVVNPPEYLDSPAIVCMQDGVVPINMQGKPICTTGSTEMIGGMDGTSGKHKLDLEQSYSNTGSWTVTKESSLTVGTSLSISVGIPDIGLGIAAGVTTSTTVTNSLTNSFSTTVGDKSSQTIEYEVKDGQTCTGSIVTKSCHVQGTGSAALVASGAVWFNYDDSRPPKNDPNGGSHFKYAVDIASVLTDINDRSSPLTFAGSMQLSSKSHSEVHCSDAKNKGGAVKAAPNATNATPNAKPDPSMTKPKVDKKKPKSNKGKPKSNKGKPKPNQAKPQAIPAKPVAPKAAPIGINTPPKITRGRRM
ncbi:hypothetical protein GALMADRAFT_159089 [Galerina marginata CBS 339.88]|uniref:Uncharacterized protein n=1 Tax=Galerina marginata (strain CBS 339.88) TaxID=685588 RepID=A0A067SM75_GALM3|nr:hypothetical protein GALMADRAFT_159089 [Galerina marginata CBS 339.88]